MCTWPAYSCHTVFLPDKNTQYYKGFTKSAIDFESPLFQVFFYILIFPRFQAGEYVYISISNTEGERVFKRISEAAFISSAF